MKYFGIDGVWGIVNLGLIFEMVFCLGCVGGYVLMEYVENKSM